MRSATADRFQIYIPQGQAGNKIVFIAVIILSVISSKCNSKRLHSDCCESVFISVLPILTS